MPVENLGWEDSGVPASKGGEKAESLNPPISLNFVKFNKVIFSLYKMEYLYKGILAKGRGGDSKSHDVTLEKLGIQRMQSRH